MYLWAQWHGHFYCSTKSLTKAAAPSRNHKNHSPPKRTKKKGSESSPYLDFRILFSPHKRTCHWSTGITHFFVCRPAFYASFHLHWISGLLYSVSHVYERLSFCGFISRFQFVNRHPSYVGIESHTRWQDFHSNDISFRHKSQMLSNRSSPLSLSNIFCGPFKVLPDDKSLWLYVFKLLLLIWNHMHSYDSRPLSVHDDCRVLIKTSIFSYL